MGCDFSLYSPPKPYVSFHVPYPVSPLFATLTKTAGVCTNNSHSGSPRAKPSATLHCAHQERPNDLARAFNCSRCRGSLRARRSASENRTQKIASTNPAIAEHATINRRLGEDFLSGGIALSTSCTTEPWRASSIFAISNCLARSSKIVSLYFTSRSLRT